MIIGIIQERNFNTRLPNKVMLPLNGAKVVDKHFERLLKSKLVDEYVVATTTQEVDNVFEDIARNHGFKIYRGEIVDLIARYYYCALKYKADYVVRICGDNPLMEASEIDRLITYHLDSDCDFTSNAGDYGCYPNGLGAEIYNFTTFEKMNKLAVEPHYREHPHKFIYDHPSLFKFQIVPCPEKYKKYAHLKLDLDTKEDYEKIKAIYDKFGHNDFHFLDYAEELCQLHGLK